MVLVFSFSGLSFFILMFILILTIALGLDVIDASKLNITDPKYIWNIDEHGSEDIAKVKRVVGIKGIKQYQIQTREKPRQTTMLTYVNGAGYALPPMVIHRGKYHDSWHIGAQPHVLV